MADAYPDVQVQGVDLSPIQPHNVPSNCDFLVDDVGAEWTYGPRFNFIHSRFLLVGVKDWAHVIRQAFTNLKPGGWVELQECQLPLTSDDGTAGPDSASGVWGAGMRDGMAQMGCDTLATLRFRELMEKAGFVDIQETHIKFPLGTWPKGEKEKKMGALFGKDISENVSGISTKIFAHGLGWSKEQVDEFVPKMQAEIASNRVSVIVFVEEFLLILFRCMRTCPSTFSTPEGPSRLCGYTAVPVKPRKSLSLVYNRFGEYSQHWLQLLYWATTSNVNTRL